MNSENAHLTEIFSAIQGEGLHVGQRQIFIRFSGCDLRCRWCDTPDSLIVKKDKPYIAEQNPGKRDFEKGINPVNTESLLSHVQSMDEKLFHQAISLTGGEPLLQSQFIKSFLEHLEYPEDGNKLQIHLETGGHRYKELAHVIELLDFVSLDLKLPSSTGERFLWDEHTEFLKILKGKAAQAKMVITDNTSEEDLLRALHLTGKYEIQNVILQPVFIGESSSFGEPSPEMLLHYQDLGIKALGRGKVKVIPQTHKFLKQL